VNQKSGWQKKQASISKNISRHNKTKLKISGQTKGITKKINQKRKMGNAKQGLTKEEAFENEKSFIKRK
jgi:hypothetical protein